MKHVIFLLVFIFPLLSFSDNDTIPKDKKEDKTWPKMKISGYVKADFYHDSRQNTAIRADHLLLFPKPETLDANGKDINAVPSTQFVPLQTRLTFNFDGVEILNADAKAIIEGEFFGMAETDINGFRLRHANMTLTWKNGISTMMGQAWHPLFVEECFPQTVNINTGIPFNPFARNPQFQLRYKLGKVQFLGAAVSQIDFMSTGPAGVSYTYLKNSSIPEIVGRFMYKTNNEKRNFLFGGAATYKTLTPRTVNSKNVQVNESVSSLTFSVFGKYYTDKFQCKLSGIAGQDLHHISMLGGYAIRYPAFEVTKDINEYELEYTPLNTISVWTDNIYGKKYQVGLFAGYTQNFGSIHNVYDWTNSKSYFARGYNIHHIYRVSPRFSYNMNNISLGIETEYTVAAYGNTLDSRDVITDLTPVQNLRVLLFAFYKF